MGGEGDIESGQTTFLFAILTPALYNNGDSSSPLWPVTP